LKRPGREDKATIKIDLLLLIVALLNLWLTHRRTITEALRRRSAWLSARLSELPPPPWLPQLRR
jgi:hypothetical protein